MECDVCKQKKQPNKDVKIPCFPCDSCRSLICLECTELSPSEIKCLPLQKRTLKFHCGKCRRHELIDILQNTIRDKEKIIQEQDEIIGLLKEKVLKNGNVEIMSTKRTYASVMKEGPKEVVKVNYPEVIIKPKSKQSSLKTKKDLETSIKPAELKIGIKKFKTTKTGMMFVTCQSKEECETLKNAVKQNMDNSYEVELSKMRNPRIKITNFTGEYTETDIEKFIKQQNPVNGEVKITYIRTNKKGEKIIFCECSPRAFRDIMFLKKLCIGWKRYPVYEDLTVPKCFKCQGFFHKMSNCLNNTICPLCSEKHEENQCPKNKKCCNNCVLSNQKYNIGYATEHYSYSQDCPALRYHMEVLKSKIDYFSER